MAGSLGELVLKVSANADRFKRDLDAAKGHAKSFSAQIKSLGGGALGDIGKGFMQGLGMGSAAQLVSGVTRAVSDLTKTLLSAAQAGNSVGDALDSWASNKVGVKGIAEMFAEAETRARGIRDLAKEMQRDVGRAKGVPDAPSQGRVDEIDKGIQALDAQRKALEKRIDRGWLNLGQTGDLKIELGNVTGAMQQLELMKSQFTEDIAAAEKFKTAQDELNKLMQKGASLTESLRTPQQNYNATIQDTLKLLEVGAIDWSTYDRAVRGAAKTLQDATAIKERAERFEMTQAIGAAEAGTTAGFSAVQAAARVQSDNGRWEREQAAKELEEQRKQTALLKRIEAALERGRTVQAANI